MSRRQPVPDRWMMTDERQGDALLPALSVMPRGTGVVFRHYGLPRGDRLALWLQVRRIARARRLVVLVAGDPLLGGAGRHGARGAGLNSRSVHDRAELVAAQRAGADLVFVSPLRATRSHAGARPLGRIRFGLLARNAGMVVIALGGVDAATPLPPGADGWAGIDAWHPPSGRPISARRGVRGRSVRGR